MNRRGASHNHSHDQHYYSAPGKEKVRLIDERFESKHHALCLLGVKETTGLSLCLAKTNELHIGTARF